MSDESIEPGDTSHDKPFGLEGVLTRPWPGMSSRDATSAIAEARAKLHLNLCEALSLGADKWDAAFEVAFVQYAKALFTTVAREAKSTDVESCLKQLKLYLIPEIIRAIEPDELHHELRFDNSANDVVGEWETRLEGAHTAFRAELGGRSNETDITFRYRCIFRLRVKEHRHSLRNRLKAALNGALIEIEPALHRRLPRARVKRSRRRGGYPAAAADHLCIAEVMQTFGPDWRTHLEDICRALHGKSSPPAFFTDEGLNSWSEAADSVSDDKQLRRRVSDYLKYRLNWTAKKNAKLQNVK